MRYQHILHIDDDQDDLELFQYAVKKISATLKYEMMTDAKQALQLLKEKKVLPDVIFLDLNMPVMTGQEFLYSIKNEEHLKSIPVIVFSTASNPTIIELTTVLGAAAFHTKPVKFDDLIHTLRSVL